VSVDLIGAVLSGVLGGRRKRSSRAARFLGRGGGGFINANTLMTAAGLAWGAYETWQAQHAAAGDTVRSGGGRVPPIPVVGGAAAPRADVGDAQDPASGRRHERLLRLAVAAANADGSMSESERTAIAAQAKAAGASEALVDELAKLPVLSEIVAGVTDARERTSLYMLAFTIVRADEQVSGAERIFLAQLANLLGLDPQVVSGLEKSVGERIDAEDTPRP
jgi:uncharacterized membrane protein YebE (DUF533 family)